MKENRRKKIVNKIKALALPLIFVLLLTAIALLPLTAKATEYGITPVSPKLTADDAAYNPNVAAGDDHSLCVDYNGLLYVWGGNRYGQLGTGRYDDEPLPVLSMFGTSFVQVAAGSRHSIALAANGDLYACGDNTYGQCGTALDGKSYDKSQWRLIMKNVKQVAAGSLHTVALTNSGEVYTFGYGKAGALGSGKTTSTATPVKVLTGAVAVEAGGNVSFAVKKNGDLYGWGYGKYYALGTGSNKSLTKPKRIATKVKSVTTSGRHTLVVKTNGYLYGCGQNDHGQLASSKTSAPVKKLTRIAKNISSASAGWNGSLYITEDYDLYGFGQLAMESTYTQDSPWSEDEIDLGYDVYKPVKLASGIIGGSFGDYHAIMFDTHGNISAFGSNTWAQLGRGSYSGIGEMAPVIFEYAIEAPDYLPELKEIRNIVSITQTEEDTAYRNAKTYRFSLADGTKGTAIVYPDRQKMLVDFYDQKLDFVITDDYMIDTITGEGAGRHGPYLIDGRTVVMFSERMPQSYQRVDAMIEANGWESIWELYRTEGPDEG